MFFCVLSRVLAISLTATVLEIDMIISQNGGTQVQTPIYYSTYHRDPQKGTPNFGKSPYVGVL